MKRLLTASCAAALLGLMPLPAAAQPEADAVEIEITDLSPVHTPGESLPVTLLLRNDGAPLEDVPLDLTVQVSVPLYRSTVTDWIADETIGSQMLTLDRRTIDVPSGETVLDIEVPAEILTWGNTTVTWGPRGLQASINVDDTTIVDRTFLITQPSFEQEPMGFTTLVPVTVQQAELAQMPTTSRRFNASVEAVREGTLGPDELLPDPLDEMLQQAAARAAADIENLTSPGITLALDSAFAADEYGTADLTEDALNSFARGQGSELILLPALDADLAAWAGTGDDRFFQHHVDQVALTEEALSDRGISARTDVLYAPGNMTAPIAEIGLDHGAELIIARRSDVPAVDQLNWTPSAHAALPELETNAAIVDEQLSGLLAGDGSELSDLDRRQTLIALTAVHYRERPNDPRPLVLSVPRGDETSATAAEISAALEALDSTSWMEGVTLSDIEDAPLDPFARHPLGSAPSDEGQLTDEMIQTMLSSGQDVSAVGDLTTRPYLFEDAVEATYSTAGAWAWTTTPGELVNRIVSIQELATNLSGTLQVQASSTINLISQASEFPVHVTSSLPIPITVDIDVHSEDRRLEFETVSTVLPPNATTTVGVPVRAVGSGNVSTRVEIMDPNGQIIGTGTDINIRVRADWENVGTAIIAGAFLIILIIGIIRSARRGTRTEAMLEAREEED